MRVDIEHIKYLQEERIKINREQLKDIEFYENGVKVDISPSIIENFGFIGLNNTDFIETDYYKTG